MNKITITHKDYYFTYSTEQSDESKVTNSVTQSITVNDNSLQKRSIEVSNRQRENFSSFEKINSSKMMHTILLHYCSQNPYLNWRTANIFKKVLKVTSLNEVLEKCELAMSKTCLNRQKMEEICTLTAKTMKAIARMLSKQILAYFDSGPELVQSLNKDILSVCEKIIQHRMNAAFYFEFRKREVISRFAKEELFTNFFGEKTLNEIFEHFIDIIPTSEGSEFEDDIYIKICKHLITCQISNLPTTILKNNEFVIQHKNKIQAMENSINKMNVSLLLKSILTLYLYESHFNFLKNIKDTFVTNDIRTSAHHISYIYSLMEMSYSKFMNIQEEQFQAVNVW